MKSLLIGTVLTLGLTTSVLAQDVAIVNTKPFTIREITPFNLVTNSYQGYLSDQGIPSGGIFLSAIRTQKVTAEDLVRGAIAKGRLPEDKINDTEYVNHVDSLLDNLDKD